MIGQAAIAKTIGATVGCSGKGRAWLRAIGLGLLCVVGRGPWLAAQVSPGASQAALPISAAELARPFTELTADSLLGRETPSLALDRTARYLVRQFQQLGLRPLLDSLWVQRYLVPGQRRLDYEHSQVAFSMEALRRAGIPVMTETGRPLSLDAQAGLVKAAYLIDAAGPPIAIDPLVVGWSELVMGSTRVALVSGRQTPASVQQADLRRKVVIYAPPLGLDTASLAQVLGWLYQSSQGVVLVGDEDSTRFAAALQRARQQPVPVLEGFLREPLGLDHWPWAMAVRPAIVRAVLASNGVELDQVRADTIPQVRDLPLLSIVFQPQASVPLTSSGQLPVNADSATSALQTAPNVVARLNGTDSVLKHQVVVIAARIDDGAKASPKQAADAPHGIRDNTAGVASLIALAHALSQPEMRPRRSVVFLAVSGGAKELWGSRFFAQLTNRNDVGLFRDPIVAALTLDLSGWPADSAAVVVEGAEDLERLALPPAWAAVAHPELGVAVASGNGPASERQAGHVPFAQWGIPSLSFSIPASPSPVARQESAEDIVARATRVASLVFYVGQAIANADEPPQWTPEVRARLLRSQP